MPHYHFAMGGAAEKTNSGHGKDRKYIYWKMSKSRKGGEYDQKYLMRTIEHNEDQLIDISFTPKFGMRAWSTENDSSYLEMGASTIENSISTIEHS